MHSIYHLISNRLALNGTRSKNSFLHIFFAWESIISSWPDHSVFIRKVAPPRGYSYEFPWFRPIVITTGSKHWSQMVTELQSRCKKWQEHLYSMFCFCSGCGRNWHYPLSPLHQDHKDHHRSCHLWTAGHVRVESGLMGRRCRQKEVGEYAGERGYQRTPSHGKQWHATVSHGRPQGSNGTLSHGK